MNILCCAAGIKKNGGDEKENFPNQFQILMTF